MQNLALVQPLAKTTTTTHGEIARVDAQKVKIGRQDHPGLGEAMVPAAAAVGKGIGGAAEIGEEVDGL